LVGVVPVENVGGETLDGRAVGHLELRCLPENLDLRERGIDGNLNPGVASEHVL
jgi:hypothetical protein